MCEASCKVADEDKDLEALRGFTRLRVAKPSLSSIKGKAKKVATESSKLTDERDEVTLVCHACLHKIILIKDEMMKLAADDSKSSGKPSEARLGCHSFSCKISTSKEKKTKLEALSKEAFAKFSEIATKASELKCEK